MYKYLIFDLDDTVLDFSGGEAVNIRRIFAGLGLTDDDLTKAIDTYRGINHKLWGQYEMGKIPRNEIFEVRFTKTLKALNLEGSGMDLEAKYYDMILHNYRILPHAKHILNELGRKYTLIAGTNGQAELQRMRLKKTDIERYFDQIYISEEMGSKKPQASFFDQIFQDNPEMTLDNTVMIGDGLYTDVLGGNNYGIATLWINHHGTSTPENIDPTYEVHTLDEIMDIL
ncbi:YjjG family noncanonical pyrimidine nucleotidase [Convivina intestini]|uniref:Putative hydrolase of the HAD superfamily n=1 Tax=Convivina intestini TaxID=1505726 RepID=A0A2U1DEZ5_9LACO|nr:YjjG family noncanonical pyrimidine nucleotidase [Convivina intestini]PVY86255.1 putative hydrolase of the HAD superfamily [Convivina intestini]CAH1851193.1 Putative HAD-hydrolase YfnB [Convivina intestini]SDB81909.1 putative hydrolase of the HAD superfamily [Leuconostocaceae bacterium R-53105]